MILPRAKTIDRQLKLFEADRLLTSGGELRWAVGEFFEGITAAVTGAIRLQTDSRADVCPDLQYDPATFFECKGVGKTGKAIMYTGRVRKYSEFVATGRALHHWIWSHKFKAMKAGSYDALYAGLAGATRQLFILDFQTVLELIGNEKQQAFNNQYNCRNKGVGYRENELYGTGWSIPIRKIRESCFRFPAPLAVGGRFPISGVEVFVSRNEFGGFLK